MGMVNTVGLVLHPARDCNSALFELLAWASKRKVTVLTLEEEADRVPGPVEPVGPLDLAARSDLMVSLGGDGTMLRAMRLSAARGRRCSASTWAGWGSWPRSTRPSCPTRCPRSTSTSFTVEPRSAVQADFAGQRPIAFNDVALARVPGQAPSPRSSSRSRAIRSCATRPTR